MKSIEFQECFSLASEQIELMFGKTFVTFIRIVEKRQHIYLNLS